MFSIAGQECINTNSYLSEGLVVLQTTEEINMVPVKLRITDPL